MNARRRISIYFLLSTLGYFAVFLPSLAQTPTNAAASQSTPRDGQHDFDWQLGSWKIHMQRLQHPLTGSTNWTELDGNVVVRKVWDGRANLAEIVTNGPSGPSRISLAASLQSAIPPVEPQFCQQQQRYSGRAHDRRIQKWPGRVLRSGNI